MDQISTCCANLFREVWISSEMLFNTKLSWLLILGPVALMGDSMGFLGEAACFSLSGIALIPCAERLSFVTEQVAEHTNGTIGALLNATFGNAPELLISTAALRAGYYRVVQLAMLGSMLCNLLFVFGMSCLVGGLRWQVQELRITSGNVSVGLLLLSVSGSLLPAGLVLGGQVKDASNAVTAMSTTSTTADIPSHDELSFCRINAAIMIFMYFLYLVFQLGTHKEEFDEEDSVAGHGQTNVHHHNTSHGPRRNLFCLSVYNRLFNRAGVTHAIYSAASVDDDGDVELQQSLQATTNGGGTSNYKRNRSGGGLMIASDDDGSVGKDGGVSDASSDSGNKLLPQNESASSFSNGYFDDYDNLSKKHQGETDSTGRRRRSVEKERHLKKNSNSSLQNLSTGGSIGARSTPGQLLPLGLADPVEEGTPLPTPQQDTHEHPESIMSFRVGIVWLFVITLCISALSDIMVDTIDGFAKRLHISQVFTSMVIVPFFSNVAEQVSAVLFAYRNEMDLCVGVTVGSAIQVMCFVLPGCVLIGWVFDRSMTLFFHAYETVCLFLAVVVIAAVLQGGTTNWLVGTTCMGIYMMIAVGFWFHTLEDLMVDAETYNVLDNSTGNP